MSDGFRNKPKILRGAFVAHSPNIPALVVVFQFNPEQLTRQHNLTFSFNDPNVSTLPAAEGPNSRDQSKTTTPRSLVSRSLLDFHRQQELTDIQAGQQVDIQEETINFELRLDATDQLNLGDATAGQFGIAPQLATLELMIRPVGEVLAQQLTDQGRYSSNRDNNPPLIVFVWGKQRVLPVNINSINITETEFNTQLEPIRATVAVNLTVIEGKNAVYTQWRSRREALWGFNPSTRSQIDVVIPG
jgi:Contractile injection system tube protein